MPKLVNRNKYRQELLEKCFYIFSRKGYSNVTMREIAAEIGVSTGTIYHYFANKQDILKQMFKYIVETNVEKYLKRVKNAQTETLEERLHLLVDFVIDFEDYYKHVLLLVLDLFRIYGSEESERIISEFSKYYTDTIAEQLNLPDQFAKSLFIYIVGLVFHSLVTPHHTPFSENMYILKNLLQSVIAKTGQTNGDIKHMLLDSLVEANH
ncbi:MAG: TetR/AcrR family transcriptional regulator [Desulfobacteraceae bacterium]|nr:TetR/AcrR family transcriptional regulator [Desulfobacteraceae bacterium]MBC2757457.1 TetR/AcrR family transcriptional regulator [Desulfobacteraceae bacterium]